MSGVVSLAQTDAQMIELEIFNEAAWGAPIQDAYVDAGLVVRPERELTEEMLDQPLYSTATETPFDLEAGFRK